MRRDLLHRLTAAGLTLFWTVLTETELNSTDHFTHPGSGYRWISAGASYILNGGMIELIRATADRYEPGPEMEHPVEWEPRKTETELAGTRQSTENENGALNDEFESCLWKVDRARKHADDLEAEIESFWATSPCEIEADGPGSYRVNRMDPLPEAIPLIAGDAAHNIRAALDHFAWAATSPQERGVHTCFPVWNSSDTRTHAKWLGP